MSEFLDKARTIEDIFYNNAVVHQDKKSILFFKI